MENIMSNDQHQPDDTERSVAREHPRKTAFVQLRNKRQIESAAASKVSFPRTGNSSVVVYTKRWNKCKCTW